MFTKLIKLIVGFSKSELYILVGALVIFLLSGLFWLTNFYYGTTVLVPEKGGQYTEGIVGQPTSLNPLIAGVTDADRDLLELLFADLGELAENITTSEDNTTWTVTLKPELKWSDGKPLTTADLLFTLETIQNPDTQSPAFNTWRGVVGQRISDREMQFSLKNPYVFFISNLENLKIAPRHIFGNVPPANLRLSNYNLEPVGSGPYQFVELTKEKNGFIKRYRLAVNENYAGSQPFIEKFNVLFFADEKTAIQSFNRREITGLGGLSPQHLADMKLGHQIFDVNMSRYYAVFMNQAAHPALKEKAVRLALAAAVDQKTISETALAGRALLVDGPIPPNVVGYHPADGEEKPTTDQIKESLTRAGWELNDLNIWTKSIDGRVESLEFTLQVPQVDFLIKTAELLAEQWLTLGIKTQVVALSPADANNVVRNRNYVLMIFGNTLRGNPDIFSFWHSSERFHPGLNLSIYNNKTVDGLLETIRQDFDAETRQEKLARLQDLIRQEQPAIFLFSPNYLYVAVRDLGGFNKKTMVLASDRFQNVEQWFLKTSRVFK